MNHAIRMLLRFIRFVASCLSISIIRNLIQELAVLVTLLQGDRLFG